MHMPVMMELNKIVINEAQQWQIIVLREVDGDRQLSIMIGKPEADAINRRLGGDVPLRPMTHDLLATVIETLGGKLDRIDITRLESETYYAELTIRQGSKTFRADTRPSDAIALGVATSVPIYVASDVLDAAGR